MIYGQVAWPSDSKKVFESTRWTRKEIERTVDKTKEEETSGRAKETEGNREREEERGFSLARSCGCQLNVPGQLCSWPSNDSSVSPAFNSLCMSARARASVLLGLIKYILGVREELGEGTRSRRGVWYFFKRASKWAPMAKGCGPTVIPNSWTNICSDDTFPSIGFISCIILVKNSL